MNVSTRSTPVTGRFTQTGDAQMQEKLARLDGQIKAKQGAVDAQKARMRSARFTPEAYKKELAKLRGLEKDLRTLTAERKQLHDVMVRA